MDGQTLISENLINLFLDTNKTHGKLAAIIGESGIGKTYIAEKFITTVSKSTFVISFKGLPTARSAFSSIYEGLANSIPKNKILEEQGVELFKRYAKLLPGLSKFIPHEFGYKYIDATANLIKQVGFSNQTSINPKIFNFIKELGGSKKIVIYAEDTQWLDSESWDFLIYLAESLTKTNWLMLLVYNDKIQTWSNRDEHLKILDRWTDISLSKEWQFHHPQRWTKDNIIQLCEMLMDKKVIVNDYQLKILHKFSSGIPRYLMSVIDVLIDRGMLIKKNFRLIGVGDWNDNLLKTQLRKSIEDRLSQIYIKVPKSKQVLEIASVLGEQFKSEEIDNLLSQEGSEKTLAKIEEISKYIKYLFGKRHWGFDHSLIHFAIYQSLGNETPKLHRKIAEYLEQNSHSSPMTIAFHYEKAGNIKKATYHKLFEVKKLIGQSMFNTALELSDKIITTIAISPFNFSIKKHSSAIILKGISLFYLVKYKQSIECLEKAILLNPQEYQLAESHRWIGKCYLNLDTKSDFRESIRFLEDSISIFKKINSTNQLGEVYADLVVAYAHNNQFGEAERCFKEAEKCFNINKDLLGMARLQRKNVIFLDSQLSAPIQLAIAETFKEHGITHERIMALNNAATEFVFLNQLDKARNILEMAESESNEINKFGSVQINNNLGVIAIINKDYSSSKSYFANARLGNTRAIEQLIVDVNASVLDILINDFKNWNPSESYLKRVLDKALSVGEDVLILPPLINYSWALIKTNRIKEAIKYLESVTPIDAIYSYANYKNVRWYRLLKNAYIKLNLNDAIKNLERQYEWCNKPENGIYHDTPYTLIDLQFWSD